MANVIDFQMVQARRSRPRARRIRLKAEALWGIGLVSPAVLGFLLWDIGPMIASIALSLSNWSITGKVEWIGLANYREILFDDPLFRTATRVTLQYALISVPSQIVFGFILALLLNERIRYLPLFRTILYLPSTLPVIATSVLWLWMYNPDFGLFNTILERFGLPRQQWIYDPDMVLPSLVIMSLWSVGPMMLIFLAGLTAVPRHLYEAVSLDGGGVWRRLRDVTLPMMTPTIFFNLVLSIIGTLQTFTQAYITTDGGPANHSLFYGLYLYRQGFQYGNLGYAAALAVLQFVFIAVLSLIVFRTSSRWVHYGGED